MIFLFDFDFHFVHPDNHLYDVVDDRDDHLLMNYSYVSNYYLLDDDYYNEAGRMNLDTYYKDDIDLDDNHVDQDNSS
jgi:hypothetical protein